MMIGSLANRNATQSRLWRLWGNVFPLKTKEGTESDLVFSVPCVYFTLYFMYRFKSR